VTQALSIEKLKRKLRENDESMIPTLKAVAVHRFEIITDPLGRKGLKLKEERLQTKNPFELPEIIPAGPQRQDQGDPQQDHSHCMEIDIKIGIMEAEPYQGY